MKTLLCLIFINLLVNGYAQNLTGLWKGNFIIVDKQLKSKNKSEDSYKFELQILQLKGGLLKGVTYSYKTKEYYGKADFAGTVSEDFKAVIIKESKIVEVEKKEKTAVCIMTCNFKYFKNSKGEEILSGTFTSNNPGNDKFCYGGDVYLVRVSNTSFPKEPFLFSQKTIKPVQALKKKITDTLNQADVKLLNKIDPITNNDSNIVIPKENKIIQTVQPLSEVLINRNNKLITSIQVNSKSATLTFFDNGIIDNDIISVYVDSQKVLDKVRVSDSAIILNLKFTDIHRKHEVIVTADNLGDIPPNTALLIISVNNKRIEIPVMSDYKTNAKILIEYNAESKVSIERFN